MLKLLINMWMIHDGKLMNDPSAPRPKPAGMYPLMRDGKIIATEEDDMDALMEADAEMRIPAAQRADERAELSKRATELGLRVLNPTRLRTIESKK